MPRFFFRSDWRSRWLSLAALGLATLAIVAASAAEIRTLAGTGRPGFSGDGGPASQAQVNQPFGVVRGADGCVYICDTGNHRIRKISTDGIIRTVVGSGRRGFAGDGGPAVSAELDEPYEVRLDQAGNLFFVEMKNHVVRRVDARTQAISTVAGTGRAGFAGDGGPANRAVLNQPHSLQLDGRGHLYVCDIGNQRVRVVDLDSGGISAFAGTGETRPTPDGAPIRGTPLNGPRAIDFDRAGNLWLALREGNAVYQLDLPAGTIARRAGTGQKGWTGNGGPARLATLSGPKGLSVADNGDVYLADTESHSVRRIDVQHGTMELVAGTGEAGDDPEGDPLRCRLNRPHGIFAAPDGAVYIGDTEAHRVRVIRPIP